MRFVDRKSADWLSELTCCSRCTELWGRWRGAGGGRRSPQPPTTGTRRRRPLLRWRPWCLRETETRSRGVWRCRRRTRGESRNLSVWLCNRNVSQFKFTEGTTNFLPWHTWDLQLSGNSLMSQEFQSWDFLLRTASGRNNKEENTETKIKTKSNRRLKWNKNKFKRRILVMNLLI